MALFDRDAEKQRKENLKRLEDRRLRFAENLAARAFRPERMFFCSNEEGGFVAIARHGRQYAVVVSPRFGEEDDFSLHLLDDLVYEREDIFEKGSGLNGAFGFGKKGARGFNLHLTLDDGERVTLPIVAGRTSWLEAPLKKNPLLKSRRRRGDANIVWDLMPIEPGQLPKIEQLLATHYL